MTNSRQFRQNTHMQTQTELNLIQDINSRITETCTIGNPDVNIVHSSLSFRGLFRQLLKMTCSQS